MPGQVTLQRVRNSANRPQATCNGMFAERSRIALQKHYILFNRKISYLKLYFLFNIFLHIMLNFRVYIYLPIQANVHICVSN